MLKFLVLAIAAITPNVLMAAGPITSGGGNVSQGPAATAGLVEFYLGGRVPQTLNIILNKVYQQLASGQFGDANPLWEKFFDRPDNSFKMLQAQRVYINKHSTCKDNNGNPTDASIFAPEGFDVCISSFSVGPKLTQIDVVPQLVALLAHEYSHLLANMTEDEAIEIQRRVLTLATEIGDIHMPLNTTRDHLRLIENLLASSQNADTYTNASAICQVFTEIEKEHLRPISDWHPRLSVLDWRGQVEVESLRYKVYSLRRQACVESKTYGWEKESASPDFKTSTIRLLDEILTVDAANYYKFYPRRLFPWIRKIAISESSESNNLRHNYRIEVAEIQSLIEIISANVESLYWLEIK